MPLRSSLLLLRALVAIAGATLLAGSAWALPSISIDADPSTPGIQSSLAAELADSFTVDVVIQNVVAPESVNGFQFDLLFDSSVLSASSVTGGDFLLPPVFTIQNNLGAVSVEFAEVSLGPFGAVGDGLLASVTFDAIGEGSSGLSLDDLIVAQPFGIPLGLESVSGAAVRVGDGGGVAPIPEPSAAILFAAGALVLRAGTRRH